MATIESFSMEAFATDAEISAWRQSILAEERNLEQAVDITQYLNYTNTSYPQHINAYSEEITTPDIGQISSDLNVTGTGAVKSVRRFLNNAGVSANEI